MKLSAAFKKSNHKKEILQILFIFLAFGIDCEMISNPCKSVEIEIELS